MTNPYPLPSGIRQTDILVGNGGSTYGPFAFKVFDTEDVQVWVRPPNVEEFSIADVEVLKVDDLPFDNFTVTFPANLQDTTSFVVASARVASRDAGVMGGTRINPDALEKEFSKIAATQQEQSRDIARGVKTDFGGVDLVVAAGIDDGHLLKKEGNRLVGGGSAQDISNARDEALVAAVAAASSSEAAAAAATTAGNSATATAASQAQAQMLVDMATAGYAGFEPGAFYDLGRLADDITLFPGDLGRLADL